MSDIFEDALAAIAVADDKKGKAREYVEKAREKWAEIDKWDRADRGMQFDSDAMKNIMGLVRQYAPVVLRATGYGGVAAALTQAGNNGLFSKILGVLGLG